MQPLQRLMQPPQQNHTANIDCTRSNNNNETQELNSSPPSPLSTSSLSSSSSSTSSEATVTPSLGVNLRVTGQCSQGGRKYMEDYFSVAYQHSENAKDLEYAFFGIFDGHGGAEAATFAKEHLMMEIINQKLFWSDSDQDVLRAIREGYIATHFAMWRDQDKWPKTANGLPSTAGTTATIAFIRHEKIYIGHVGDSAIVLGYQHEGEKCWRAKQLTVDHKPESMAERARIMRSGGKVIVKSGVPRVVWNRPRNAGHRGPIRYNTPIDEIPFLAVARSLGDLWSYNSLCNEFVVSPDPDVRVIKINPKTFRCLIFGTDGLWNVVTPQEAVNTVYQKEMINERLQQQRNQNHSNENGWMNPSKALVDRALSTWSSKKMRADNTSVVTVILHPPSNVGAGGTCNGSNVIDTVSSAAQIEGCTNDNFGLEYAQINAAYVDDRDTITYREMAEKYMPPEEYRNFNYYEDIIECNNLSVSNGNKSYYNGSYGKLSMNGQRFSMPNTLEALEFMCENKEEQMTRNLSSSSGMELETNISKSHIAKANFSLGMVDDIDDDYVDDGDDDEDDLDDDADNDGDDGSNEENKTGQSVSQSGSVLNEYTTNYLSEGQQKVTKHSSAFGISGANGDCIDETTSSYMSTFAESYNTLLGGDSIVTDGHMTAEITTSNSSSSYKSHSATDIQELMKEQQRYQQECMSEEEGYSLTKLETRREQQRCSDGVQTFRIFQQRAHHSESRSSALPETNNALRSSCSNTQSTAISEQSSYLWEPRFSNVFSASSSRYQQQSYQPSVEQQQSAAEPHFIMEHQEKTLELQSLLEQERKEEQQVEFERQMQMERLKQQSQQEDTNIQQQQKERDIKSMHTDVFESVKEVTSDLALAPIVEPETTLVEEYLVEDVEEDTTVQIHEISSSSSLFEGEVAAMLATPSTSSTFSSATSLQKLVTPLPTSSTSHESVYHDILETTTDSTFYAQNLDEENNTEKAEAVPKIIEKLEKIEILHEKPELVIEASPSTPSISTRSKIKANAINEVSSTRRRCRSNLNSRQQFPNIPNENQHEQSKKVTMPPHNPEKNTCILHMKPIGASGSSTNVIYNKRQLRSTSNGNSNNSGTNTIINNCNVASSSSNSGRKHFVSNIVHSSSSNGSIDYCKRTLRSRNSLTRDLKAKTTMLTSSIKRSAASVTTRFLRTQAVNLINMHQNQQILVTNNKNNRTSSPAPTLMAPLCHPRKEHQQQSQLSSSQQRPLTASSLNFINLRSRQINGVGGNNCIVNFNERKQQNLNVASNHNLSRVTPKPIQVRNATANSSISNVAATTSSPTYVRRNLRSLSVRPIVNGRAKVTASTSTTGLTHYSKSMRSQSSTALVTPPPPSPKHLNPTTPAVTITVTRAKTGTDTLLISPAQRTTSISGANTPTTTTPATLLGNNSNLMVNRKRNCRSSDMNFNSTPILPTARTPKRLRR